MIPGSEFLQNLNQAAPKPLSSGTDHSYISVAGIGARDFENFFHREIKDMDDEALSVSSVSLLEFDIPLIITDDFHSKEDDPENYDGLTNSEGIVLPLLKKKLQLF